MTKNDIFDLIRQNALDYLDILEREDNDWPFPPKKILPSLSQEFQNDVEIVKSLDENVMWMGLCLNQLLNHGIAFDK